MNASLKEALEHFLNQPDIIKLMRENSNKGRPAVEGLGDILFEEFDEFHEGLQEHRTRQRIGKMVKEVLENNGYKLESYSRPVKGKLFTQGRCYSALTVEARILRDWSKANSSSGGLCISGGRSNP